MANLRSGKYGGYYGSFYNESEALTQSEMEKNALYIYSYLHDLGWSANAVAGLLGNMEHESALNPGRWEGNDVGNGPGYGLVQWTPYTNLTSWCASNGWSDPSEMDANLARIIYELENGLQYYSTTGYLLSFREFTQSAKSPYYLACAFAWNYERSWVVLYGSEEEKEALRQLRGGSAQEWYTFLTGLDPIPPSDDTGDGNQKKRKAMSLLLMYMATRRC